MTDPDFDPPEGRGATTPLTLDCGQHRALMEAYHVVSQKFSRKGRRSSVHCLRLAWGDTSWPGERRQLEDQEMSTYSQLLRDPRWQKKRLKIMERDRFECRKCESTRKTLNVHHNYYLEGAAPWEYPDSALFTLCEDCHKEEEISKDHLNEMLVLLLRQGGALNAHVHHLTTLINDICDQGDDKSGVPMILHVLGKLWDEKKGHQK